MRGNPGVPGSFQRTFSSRQDKGWPYQKRTKDEEKLEDIQFLSQEF